MDLIGKRYRAKCCLLVRDQTSSLSYSISLFLGEDYGSQNYVTQEVASYQRCWLTMQ